MSESRPERRPEQLDRARTLARLLDRSFRIPGTSIRFGLDPILGLLPVGGDVAAALGSGYILFVAWRNGAPGALIGRMLLNVLVDTVAGSVPVLGDLFDAGWKANSRNVALLESWLGESGAGDRQSVLLLVGIVTVLVALVAGLAAALWWAVQLIL
jgi:hypothetical protein